MNTLKYALSLSTGAFSGPMRGAMGAIGGLTNSLSKVGNIITGFASLPGAIQTLVEPFTKPITLAADMEALETSFAALLKSAPAAKSMVADLMEFADATPFNPEPVAATGKQLLAFGFAAKQVKPLLKDIGDLAAAMDKPIEEVGDAFGRLNAGQFGEAFEAMRRFGISLQGLKGQGLVFDKGGSFQGTADQAMEAVRRIIEQKFGGGMAALSRTGKGMFSTFQGYWNALQRNFGMPIMTALKPVLDDATGLLKSWLPIATEFGAKIGTAITSLRDVTQKGDLGKALQIGLTIAGKEFVNILVGGINGTIRAFGTGLRQAGELLAEMFGNEKLMGGLKDTIFGIGELFKAQIFEAAAAIKEAFGFKDEASADDQAMAKNLQGAVDRNEQQRAETVAKGGDTTRIDSTLAGLRVEIARRSSLRDQAKLSRETAQSRFGTAGDQFQAADIGSLVQSAMEKVQLTKEEFMKGYDATGNVFDTKKDRAGLAELLAPAALSVSGFATTADAAKAALASIIPLAQTRFVAEANPDGVSNRRETILNPQAMERLLNPGGSGKEETLATRLAARLMADPVMATIKQAVARIAENTANRESASATF